jgi:SOS-response transcriptional repressor LexA
MTEQEIRALDFIRSKLEGDGIAPTLQEIATHLGIRSKTNAHRIIGNLVNQRVLERRRATHRGLRIIGAVDLRGVPTRLLNAELARRARAERLAA